MLKANGILRYSFTRYIFYCYAKKVIRNETSLELETNLETFFML